MEAVALGQRCEANINVDKVGFRQYYCQLEGQSTNKVINKVKNLKIIMYIITEKV